MQPSTLSAASGTMVSLALLAGYLLGSLPFALWISRARGVDILKVGSGNPGMTNVWRTLGWKPALPVALLDTLKGGLAAWAGALLTGSPLWALLAGIAAVLGHSFSFWIGFKGGKSVLTAFGVFLYLSPWASLAAFAVWAVTMFLFRYISLASILAAASLPALVALETLDARGGRAISPVRSPVFWAAAAVGLFVIVRHRANIGRLLRGEEAKFKGKTGDAS
jgi:glycerol-3-phosphate acyltransferase PlsY